MNRLRTLKRIIGVLLLVSALVPVLGGCASRNITPPFGGGAVGASTQSTGEAWYVRNTYYWFVLFFYTSSDIYYCEGKGTCQQAVIKE